MVHLYRIFCHNSVLSMEYMSVCGSSDMWKQLNVL